MWWSRRFAAAGVAIVLLGLGIPYLMWRSETHGRFRAVAGVLASEMDYSRGVGPPSDEAVGDRLVEIARARGVTVEDVTVTHSIVQAPVAVPGSRSAPAGIAEYVVHGTLGTTYSGVEASAPLVAVVRTHFAGP